MPLHPIVFPAHVGAEALVDLRRVPWADLEFAYNHREHDQLYYDVEASLRALGDEAWGTAIDALYANVFHQKTVYEATAYAVPFLAAMAAGPETPPRLRVQLVILLTDIALSSSFVTEDGTLAGALGEGVDDLIRDALRGCTASYDAIAGLDPATADAFPAILALADDPTKARFDAVLGINERLFAEMSAHDDD